MKFMVDTHILIWAFNNPAKIHDDITHILTNEDNAVYFSQISLWEIAIKYRLGKLDLKGHTPEEFFCAVEKSFIRCQALASEDLISSYRLPLKHKDPFDRMIVWQCIRGGFILLSADSSFEAYEENCLQLILNN